MRTQPTWRIPIGLLGLLTVLTVYGLLVARYVACKSGHAINNQLVRALLAQQDAWELVTYSSVAEAPAAFRQEWKLA